MLNFHFMRRLSRSILVLFLLSFVAFSCKEDERQLTPELAASVQLQVYTDHFKFSSLASERFLAKITDPSGIVERYELYAFITSDGQDSELVLLTTIEEFPDEIYLTINSIASAFGKIIEDFSFGDKITFVGVVVSADGSTFRAYPPESSNVGFGQFSSTLQPWLFEMPIACPIENKFVGTYEVRGQTTGDICDILTFGCGHFSGIHEAVLEKTGDFERTTDVTFLSGFPVEIGIEFRCLSANLIDSVDTQVGCGGPSYVFQPKEGGAFNQDDDSSFTVFLQFYDQCGLGDSLVSELTFTKVER